MIEPSGQPSHSTLKACTVGVERDAATAKLTRYQRQEDGTTRDIDAGRLQLLHTALAYRKCGLDGRFNLNAR